MANTQTWIILLVFYFVMIFAIEVTLAKNSDISSDGTVTFQNNDDLGDSDKLNSSLVESTIDAGVSVWNLPGAALGFIVGFFNFAVFLEIGGGWAVLINLFFIWMPLVALLLMVYYSIRGI